MVVVQLAQSLAVFVASVLATLGQAQARRHARATESMTWHPSGQSTATRAIITLKLGRR